MKKVVLLGATGSIGNSVLDVIRKYPENFELIGISGYRNHKKIKEIIDEFHPKYVAINEENKEYFLNYNNIEFFYNENGLELITQIPDYDIIIIAIAGLAGLKPTLSAIINSKNTNKTILTANKESFLAGGDLIKKYTQEYNISLIPIDSEHNAIFNLMKGVNKININNIILTASGGPFLHTPITENITKQEVLKHPTWKMGNYITVNSATLMNKGFEVIEAHYLFDINYNKIKVLIHPQSLVHGIVETIDGSFYMLASPNDMRYPISLAMFYPDIPESKFPHFKNFHKNLEFFEPDYNKFPLLKLAYEAGEIGNIATAALNSANEYIVDLFLKDKIPFIKIPKLIKSILTKFLDKYGNLDINNIDDIFNIDIKVKEIALSIINN